MVAVNFRKHIELGLAPLQSTEKTIESRDDGLLVDNAGPYNAEAAPVLPNGLN